LFLQQYNAVTLFCLCWDLGLKAAAILYPAQSVFQYSPPPQNSRWPSTGRYYLRHRVNCRLHFGVPNTGLLTMPPAVADSLKPPVQVERELLMSSFSVPHRTFPFSYVPTLCPG
jgi:hypothetical protein